MFDDNSQENEDLDNGSYCPYRFRPDQDDMNSFFSDDNSPFYKDK